MVRNYKLDNLRALAILIVVVGHSLILYDPSWGLISTSVTYEPFRILKSVINVIQMPLFFSLSGFLFFWSVNKHSFKQLASGKIKRLLIPFIIILLLYTDPIKIFLNVSGFESVSPLAIDHLHLMNLGHLWFIPVLFACFLLSYYPARIEKNTYQLIFFGIFLILSVVSSKLPQEFQISNISHYLVYFYFGFLLNRYNLLKLLNGFPKIVILSALAGILVVCMFIPTYLSAPLVVCSISLIYFLIPERSFGFANLIAATSFGIYLLHSPLVYITYTYLAEANPWIVFGINACIWGG